MNEAARSRLSEIEERHERGYGNADLIIFGKRDITFLLQRVRTLEEALERLCDAVDGYQDLRFTKGHIYKRAAQARAALASSSASEGSEAVTPRPPSE